VLTALVLPNSEASDSENMYLSQFKYLIHFNTMYLQGISRAVSET
jgi:hypothetical protein